MTEARSPSTGGRARAPARPAIRRLSRYDLHCLAVETPARPIHIGILAVIDGTSLLDPAGQLHLAELHRELGGRIASVPELRRVVFHPGHLAGQPIWVDDPGFEIDRHVTEVRLSPPGDEAALLALTERLLAAPLDRSRPLWRMWFVTGLAGGRLGVLVVLHHALADGRAAMRMVRSLLESPITSEGTGSQEACVTVPPPPWGTLVRNNVEGTAQSAMRLARPATWQRIAKVVRYVRLVNALARRAAVTSLNAPVGPRRRLATLRLAQADARRVARAHGCGVNDVVLSLIAGGVRALLDARVEPVGKLQPRAGIAVALFSADRAYESGNDIGTLHVPLPIPEADPAARLPIIAAARVEAMRSPLVAVEPILRAWVGRIGAVRRSMERQRLVNLAETYLPGPPAAIHILGAKVLDLLPIAPLTGNLGLSFVALSYAGRLTVAVRADADHFPDLDVLLAAMDRDWRTLAAAAIRDGSASVGSSGRQNPRADTEG